jgi:thiol-disulfide isomerase/thioredoxin
MLAGASTLALAATWRKPTQAADLKALHWVNPNATPSTLPPLRLVAADGSAHTLAEFAGQGVILNFWATWCVPCVAEMPALAKLAAQLQTDHIAIVPFSSDRGGATAVEKFYRTHEITGLPIWLDPDGDAGHTLKLRGIPTTLIIDRQGRERARAEGAMDWSAPESVGKIKALVG